MEIRHKWLLDFCSYYDGKENNEPDHTSGMLWEYERVWVMRMQNWDFSLGEVNEYIHYGVGDFNADDGVPISFKTILFNRYMHWNFCGTVEGFKEWYLATYKNRLAEKKLNKGKRILNSYRLAFLEYRCNRESIEKTPGMDYMFEIANAVSEHKILGIDASVTIGWQKRSFISIDEELMCNALSHADKYGFRIELVKDFIQKHNSGFLTYHIEFKEIRERFLKYLTKNSIPIIPFSDTFYDDGEYVGFWNNKYVYKLYNEDYLEPILWPCKYILIDAFSIEEYEDTDNVLTNKELPFL